MRASIAILLLLMAVPAPAGAAGGDVLLGRLRPEALPGLGPEWAAGRDAYEPAPEDLRVLAAFPVPATLDVYLGTWCPDSLREVPRLLKILDLARPEALRVRFYGIDRTKERPARLVRRVALERVPTFVLTVGGREVGRIVEMPETTLEHDLALLAARAAGPPGPPGPRAGE